MTEGLGSHESARDSSSNQATPQEGRFFRTDMPVGVMVVLLALGLPRTVLADLDIVPLRVGFSTEMRDAEEDGFRAAEELGIDLSRREPSSVEEV
jgi:hypothetical protein